MSIWMMWSPLPVASLAICYLLFAICYMGNAQIEGATFSMGLPLGEHMDDMEPSASCISWSNNGSSPDSWHYFASLRSITFHFTFCIIYRV